MSSSLIKKGCIGFLTFVILFIIWELFSSSHVSLRFVLPAPSNIAITLWQHSGRFLFHTLSTLKVMLGGFIIAFLIAFPMAWMMALLGPLRAILQPTFVGIQCVPMFVLAPLMVIWFGWSYTAIVVPTALMIFFPLTMNIYQGIRSTPKNLLEFFYLHQASAWQTFYKLQLPWSIPHIFAGLRIAIALAGIGAVAGEWAGAQEGLGLLMLESRRGADLEMMFGALTCVTLLSIAFYGFITFLEKKATQRYRLHLTLNRLVCMISLLLILNGCNQSSSTKETSLILDWLPNPNHVALYAGIEKGYFMEQGINLRILKVADPSDSIPYLTSKQVDLCLTYMPHTLRAMSYGADVVPIGILVEEPLNALIYRKGEGISNPEDLSGRVVGYCVDGSNNGCLSAILQYRNVVPKQWQNASFDLVSMLATKNVDFIYGAYWNIEVENLLSAGVETDFFPLIDFGVPSYYELIILARAQSLQTAPEFVEAFQRAMQSSIDFSTTYPEEAFEIYLRANPDKSQKTQNWERQAWYKTVPVLAQQQRVDSIVWNNFVEWLIVQKLIDSSKVSPRLFMKSN